MIYNKSFKLIELFSFVAILSLSVFYIFQINQSIKNSYLAQIYQQKVEVLLDETQELENEYTFVNSLENLLPAIQELELEKIKEISYLNLYSDQFAEK
jgi:hypothetical protein